MPSSKKSPRRPSPSGTHLPTLTVVTASLCLGAFLIAMPFVVAPVGQVMPAGVRPPASAPSDGQSAWTVTITPNTQFGSPVQGRCKATLSTNGGTVHCSDESGQNIATATVSSVTGGSPSIRATATVDGAGVVFESTRVETITGNSFGVSGFLETGGNRVPVSGQGTYSLSPGKLTIRSEQFGTVVFVQGAGNSASAKAEPPLPSKPSLLDRALELARNAGASVTNAVTTVLNGNNPFAPVPPSVEPWHPCRLQLGIKEPQLNLQAGQATTVRSTGNCGNDAVQFADGRLSQNPGGMANGWVTIQRREDTLVFTATSDAAGREDNLIVGGQNIHIVGVPPNRPGSQYCCPPAGGDCRHAIVRRNGENCPGGTSFTTESTDEVTVGILCNEKCRTTPSYVHATGIVPPPPPTPEYYCNIPSSDTVEVYPIDGQYPALPPGWTPTMQETRRECGLSYCIRFTEGAIGCAAAPIQDRSRYCDADPAAVRENGLVYPPYCEKMIAVWGPDSGGFATQEKCKLKCVQANVRSGLR